MVSKLYAVIDTNVTGNIKHFPKTAIVVTPTEFLNILISQF